MIKEDKNMRLLSPADRMDFSATSRQHRALNPHHPNSSHNAISNTCASTHAGEPNEAATSESASSVATGNNVVAKDDDDGGSGGDDDPDCNRHKKRQSSLHSSVSPTLVQRTTSRRILRMPEVVAKVGLSRSTIYAKLKANEFVSPIHLGVRAIGFFESDVDAWLESRSLVSVAA